MPVGRKKDRRQQTQGIREGCEIHLQVMRARRREGGKRLRPGKNVKQNGWNFFAGPVCMAGPLL
jgi:hypothetical protein